MPTKTVTLSGDAYERLALFKREDETFSDAILRLVGSQIRLTDYAGAWAGADPAKIQRVRHLLDQPDT